MRVSPPIFHLASTPVFVVKQHGASRWIEVTDPAEPDGQSFALFVDRDLSFDALTRIAAALTAAWRDGECA